MNKKHLIAAIFAIIATAAGLRHPAQSPASTPSPQTAQQGANAISTLTAQQHVTTYLQQHQHLPDFYLQKRDARKQGWDPATGNLCHVLPGRAIGGDRFSNREGALPEKAGRRWFEADVNYRCGQRGSDRLLYSSDCLIFVTRDHYRHFQQVN